jgi:hypothetical protein
MAELQGLPLVRERIRLIVETSNSIGVLVKDMNGRLRFISSVSEKRLEVVNPPPCVGEPQLVKELTDHYYWLVNLKAELEDIKNRLRV